MHLIGKHLWSALFTIKHSQLDTGCAVWSGILHKKFIDESIVCSSWLLQFKCPKTNQKNDTIDGISKKYINW